MPDNPANRALEHQELERKVQTFTNELHYSYRSAWVGAIRHARRAGT